jgi:hypothetical protein
LSENERRILLGFTYLIPLHFSDSHLFCCVCNNDLQTRLTPTDREMVFLRTPLTNIFHKFYFKFDLLTSSMDPCPSDADSRSGVKKFLPLVEPESSLTFSQVNPEVISYISKHAGFLLRQGAVGPPPKLKGTSCGLSVTTNSKCLQLPSISGGCLLHPQSEEAQDRDERASTLHQISSC